MFLVTVHDTERNQLQINGGAIAYYTKGPSKGAIIHFSSIVNGAFLTMEVLETPEQITTLVNAKLRK